MEGKVVEERVEAPKNDRPRTLGLSHFSPNHIQVETEKGSVANLRIGIGSKTGCGLEDRKEEETRVADLYGAPDRNRTCNPWIRSPILYPIELRAHAFIFNDMAKAVKLVELARVKRGSGFPKPGFQQAIATFKHL